MWNDVRIFISLLVAAVILIAGCQSSVRFTSSKYQDQKIKSSSETTLSPIRANIISEAQKWLGTPYCYGGSNTKCTDCSGFVYEIFSKFGYKLPRTAAEQYTYSYRIEADLAQAGDLIFFSNGSKISHVGIYAGNGNMIHASSSSGVVVQSLEGKYLNMQVAGFGRVVN